MKHASYPRLLAMTALSALVMHGLMYFNTWSFDHVEFSQTRVWMTLIMAAGMLPIMLAFMWKMYPNKAVNVSLLCASALVMAFSAWAVRSQKFVDDTSWMRAMIPHHSIAILTSTRAQIVDPRVRALADGIIRTQEREISEMQALIADLQDR